MTRAAFLAALRHGLRGVPPQTIEEIVTDYDAHFTDGLADGRSEAEVAAALGEPGRLARELRAEAQFRRYEEAPNAAGAAGAIAAFIGLGALDILLLLVVLFPVAAFLISWLAVGISGLFGGVAMMTVTPFFGLPGGPLASIIAGIGLVAGSTGALALLTLVSIGLVNGLVWYGRLHFKVLKPAMGSNTEGTAV